MLAVRSTGPEPRGQGVQVQGGVRWVASRRVPLHKAHVKLIWEIGLIWGKLITHVNLP